MANARRSQLIAAAAALVLLAAAWLVTVRGEDDRSPSAATIPTTAAPRSTTTAVPADTEPVPEPEPAPDPATLRNGLTFTDVTVEAGLAEPHAAETPDEGDVVTGGVAVADYDADGDQDLFLTRLGLPNRLMQNDGRGRFTDVAASAGVGGPDQANGSAAAVWGDADGDGDLDLFATGAGNGRHTLFVNDGRGRFTDGTEAASLVMPPFVAGLPGTLSYGAAFADWDHDDDLDLAVLQWYRPEVSTRLPVEATANGGHVDLCERRPTEPMTDSGTTPRSLMRLYENLDGRFVDSMGGSGIDADQIAGFQPIFADADGDGWEDLFVTGDFCSSYLFHNREGEGWQDITHEAGLGTDENGMGSVVEDLDGDGHLDWFISAVSYPSDEEDCPVPLFTVGCSGNRMFLGDGKGGFTDATDRFGVRDGYWGWGAVGQDLNDDGHRDLFQVNGFRELGGQYGQVDAASASYRDHFDQDPNRLFLGNPDGAWPDAAALVGIRDATNGKGVVAFDADGDGDLDLVLAPTEDPPVLYRNDSPAGAGNHRLTIRLRQPTGANRFAIGAEVFADLGDGEAPRRLAVRASGSFQSGDPTDLHLGLGSHTSVPRLEVRWPAGGGTQVLTNVAADQVLEITRDR